MCDGYCPSALFFSPFRKVGFTPLLRRSYAVGPELDPELVAERKAYYESAPNQGSQANRPAQDPDLASLDPAINPADFIESAMAAGGVEMGGDMGALLGAAKGAPGAAGAAEGIELRVDTYEELGNQVVTVPEGVEGGDVLRLDTVVGAIYVIVPGRARPGTKLEVVPILNWAPTVLDQTKVVECRRGRSKGGSGAKVRMYCVTREPLGV